MEQEELEAIEDGATRLLAQVPDWIWNGEELPVPVEAITDSLFGLLVRDVEDMTTAPGCPALEPGQAISGLLLAGPGEIWVNASEAREWPARRRFTIGHELGHWVLHRSGQQSLFCRHTSVDPEQEEAADTRPPLPVTEEEANAFAAALLMPAHLIEQHYHRLDSAGKFERLCELFHCSNAAMGRRLHAVI